MGVQQELFKFKHYIIGALIALLAFFIYSYLFKMLISFILYIYPLLICTSLLVITTSGVFTNTTTPNNDCIPIPRPAAEIIDYVVAGNNLHQHRHHHHHHLDNYDHPELPPLENDDELPPKSD